MLIAIIIILIVLWILGYLRVSAFPIPDIVLFNINNRPITLWDLLILLVIGWAISLLPRPLQAIATVLLLLWVLSVLGIFIFAAIPNLLVVIIILVLIFSIL